jgi:hypothetical protein
MMESNMNEQEATPKPAEQAEQQNRRDVMRGAGKFAIYAAPFTVLALKGNAQSAGGSGTSCLGCTSSPHARH